MEKRGLAGRFRWLLETMMRLQGIDVQELDTSLDYWEPKAPGNKRRIEALKKAHDLGIKTFISCEPWIPGTTKPIEIMEALGPWVDRWIIGTLNYMGVDRSFYREEMPELIHYVEANNLVVKWKKELKPYLSEKPI